MKLENLETLKIGDTIYSFVNNNFYVYKVVNINLFTHEITVCAESINNVKSQSYFIIDIPVDDRYHNIKYGYEFALMDPDLNTAYQNYSKYVKAQINKLSGMRANMKGLKRKYMLDNNMIPNNEKTWKELGYKSQKEYYDYRNEIYDDLKHAYIM